MLPIRGSVLVHFLDHVWMGTGFSKLAKELLITVPGLLDDVDVGLTAVFVIAQLTSEFGALKRVTRGSATL